MLLETIHANSGTDVDAAVSRLQEKSADAGLAPMISEMLTNQVREVLTTLVEQGKRIAAVGSQMEVTRDLTGDGYLIQIIFREGVKRTFLQSLFDRFRG